MRIRVFKLINIIACILIIIGVSLLLIASHVRKLNAATQASPGFTTENSTARTISDPTTTQGNPVDLRIPSLNIDKQIIKGVFDKNTQQWTLTLDKVQYAAMTNQPNDKQGVTFMYAHNRRGLFAKLPSIKAGAIAEVITDNGYIFQYKFISSKRISPTDISVFSYQGSPILVLQTCVGAFFQDRQLFTFELIGVSNV